MEQNNSSNPSSFPARSRGLTCRPILRWRRSAAPNTNLCNNCANLPIREALLYIHSVDLKYLYGFSHVVQIKHDCVLCTMAIEALQGQTNPLYTKTPATVGFSISKHSRNVIRIYDKSDGRRSTGKIRVLKNDTKLLKPCKSEEPPGFEEDFFGRRINDRQIDFNLVRAWLYDCENNLVHHGGASISKPIDLILIDVVEKRLVEKSSTVRYLALSYVWGQAGGLQTVKQNYDLLRRKGSLSPNRKDIPRVIADGMILSRKLRERYLWVDRLCIIQDGTAKHENIQEAGKVYSHALMTICALSGKDANHGLPGVRPGSRPPQTIERVQGVRCMPALPSLQYALESSLHTTRGWTFQEVLLSPRCLFVSDRQVYFTCFRDTVRSEDAIAVRDLSIRNVYGLLGGAGLYGGLVERYTKRSLSYDSDVLNAFAGVMTILGRQYRMDGWEEHAAGLPVRDFLYALLWAPLGTPIRRTLLTRGQPHADFPSWSWVGWKGPISYQSVSHWRADFTSWDQVHWRERVFTPISMKITQPTRTQRSIYYPQGCSHEDPCLVAIWERQIVDTQKKQKGDVKWGMLDSSFISSLSGRSILQFRTLAISANCFSYRKDRCIERCEDTNSYPLFDCQDQLCGATIGAVPSGIDSLYSNCKYVFLCYGKDPLFSSAGVRVKIYDLFCHGPQWCCVPFFLLIQPCGDFWERVALAVIDPKAFETQQPQWEYVQLT